MTRNDGTFSGSSGGKSRKQYGAESTGLLTTRLSELSHLSNARRTEWSGTLLIRKR